MKWNSFIILKIIKNMTHYSDSNNCKGNFEIVQTILYVSNLPYVIREGCLCHIHVHRKWVRGLHVMLQPSNSHPIRDLCFLLAFSDSKEPLRQETEELQTQADKAFTQSGGIF